MSRLPSWAERARRGWTYDGRTRPEFAVRPTSGQESVWDYPRPPRLEPVARLVSVRSRGIVLAETSNSFRVCETAGPPTFYLPPDSICEGALREAKGSSRCEWKGVARYWDVASGDGWLERAAWSYPEPFESFSAIRDFVSFYPARLECSVAGEPVVPQPGGFYGGWVTSDLVGPFKGEPGSESW